MRRTVATAMTALVLTFGGAGVAQATTHALPASTASVNHSQTTPDSDSDNNEPESDKTGLWGLLGLLGLLGLVGLKPKRDTVHTAANVPNPDPKNFR